ncbi:MAG: hypothetical protein KAY83_05540, partial [Agitococcus sp.]|nr:hypothetical protein [Agitococcus sp.]
LAADPRVRAAYLGE